MFFQSKLADEFPSEGHFLLAEFGFNISQTRDRACLTAVEAGEDGPRILVAAVDRRSDKAKEYLDQTCAICAYATLGEKCIRDPPSVMEHHKKSARSWSEVVDGVPDHFVDVAYVVFPRRTSCGHPFHTDCLLRMIVSKCRQIQSALDHDRHEIERTEQEQEKMDAQTLQKLLDEASVDTGGRAVSSGGQAVSSGGPAVSSGSDRLVSIWSFHAPWSYMRLYGSIVRCASCRFGEVSSSYYETALGKHTLIQPVRNNVSVRDFAAKYTGNTLGDGGTVLPSGISTGKLRCFVVMTRKPDNFHPGHHYVPRGEWRSDPECPSQSNSFCSASKASDYSVRRVHLKLRTINYEIMPGRHRVGDSLIGNVLVACHRSSRVAPVSQLNMCDARFSVMAVTNRDEALQCTRSFSAQEFVERGGEGAIFNTRTFKKVGPHSDGVADEQEAVARVSNGVAFFIHRHEQTCRPMYATHFTWAQHQQQWSSNENYGSGEHRPDHDVQREEDFAFDAEASDDLPLSIPPLVRQDHTWNVQSGTKYRSAFVDPTCGLYTQQMKEQVDPTTARVQHLLDPGKARLIFRAYKVPFGDQIVFGDGLHELAVDERRLYPEAEFCFTLSREEVEDSGQRDGATLYIPPYHRNHGHFAKFHEFLRESYAEFKQCGDPCSSRSHLRLVSVQYYPMRNHPCTLYSFSEAFDLFRLNTAAAAAGRKAGGTTTIIPGGLLRVPLFARGSRPNACSLSDTTRAFAAHRASFEDAVYSSDHSLRNGLKMPVPSRLDCAGLGGSVSRVGQMGGALTLQIAEFSESSSLKPWVTLHVTPHEVCTNRILNGRIFNNCLQNAVSACEFLRWRRSCQLRVQKSLVRSYDSEKEAMHSLVLDSFVNSLDGYFSNDSAGQEWVSKYEKLPRTERKRFLMDLLVSAHCKATATRSALFANKLPSNRMDMMASTCQGFDAVSKMHWSEVVPTGLLDVLHSSDYVPAAMTFADWEYDSDESQRSTGAWSVLAEVVMAAACSDITFDLDRSGELGLHACSGYCAKLTTCVCEKQYVALSVLLLRRGLRRQMAVQSGDFERWKVLLSVAKFKDFTMLGYLNCANGVEKVEGLDPRVATRVFVDLYTDLLVGIVHHRDVCTLESFVRQARVGLDGLARRTSTSSHGGDFTLEELHGLRLTRAIHNMVTERLGHLFEAPCWPLVCIVQGFVHEIYACFGTGSKTMERLHDNYVARGDERAWLSLCSSGVQSFNPQHNMYESTSFAIYISTSPIKVMYEVCGMFAQQRCPMAFDREHFGGGEEAPFDLVRSVLFPKTAQLGLSWLHIFAASAWIKKVVPAIRVFVQRLLHYATDPAHGGSAAHTRGLYAVIHYELFTSTSPNCNLLVKDFSDPVNVSPSSRSPLGLDYQRLMTFVETLAYSRFVGNNSKWVRNGVIRWSISVGGGSAERLHNYPEEGSTEEEEEEEEEAGEEQAANRQHQHQEEEEEQDANVSPDNGPVVLTVYEIYAQRHSRAQKADSAFNDPKLSPEEFWSAIVQK